MSPDELVELWQRVHEPLSDSLRARFLARSEVGELLRLDEEFVVAAVENHTKLVDILAEARRMRRVQSRRADHEWAERTRAEHERRERERLEREKRRAEREQAEQERRRRDAKARRSRLPRIKFSCAGCGREFVDERRVGVQCRRCGTDEHVRPVCRGCGRPGEWRWAGRCEPCYDAASAASEAAGPGARGPEGVTVRDPDRRKRRWSGQNTEGPGG